MSGAGAKARWCLETQVPELHQFIKRKIFTEQEVAQIVKKRSDFEHVINGRGEATPLDFARYAEFEMNLHTLCQRRMKRRKIRDDRMYWDTRRVYFIMDRATRKFPGDVRLWMQYVEYARGRKAYKKVKELLAACLRLHPNKSEIWVYAAAFVLEENADMAGARAYMQRGVRFCKRSKSIWLEYARLEMIYIGKIAARRRILGLDNDGKRKRSATDRVQDMDTQHDRPAVVAEEDTDPSLKPDNELDDITLEKLENTPALTGAIPIAIFDSAMAQFQNDGILGRQFFDLVAGFPQASCSRTILQHITEYLCHSKPDSIESALCQLRMPLFGLEAESLKFPSALGATLRAASKLQHQMPAQQQAIASATAQLLIPYAAKPNLDRDLQKVLNSSIGALLKTIGQHETERLAQEFPNPKAGAEGQYIHRLSRMIWEYDSRSSPLKGDVDGQGTGRSQGRPESITM